MKLLSRALRFYTTRHDFFLIIIYPKEIICAIQKRENIEIGFSSRQNILVIQVQKNCRIFECILCLVSDLANQLMVKVNGKQVPYSLVGRQSHQNYFIYIFCRQEFLHLEKECEDGQFIVIYDTMRRSYKYRTSKMQTYHPSSQFAYFQCGRRSVLSR